MKQENPEAAQRFLADLQRATYARLGLDPRPPTAGVTDKWLDAYMARTYGDLSGEDLAHQRAVFEDVNKQAIRSVPSPYEDPGRYQTIKQHAQRIESAAAQQGIHIAKKPLIGTMPTGQVNAMTYLVPCTTDHIVLLERELFTFALLASKAVCCAFPIVASSPTEGTLIAAGLGAAEDRIQQQPQLVEHFIEVAMAYALTGRPSVAPPYWPERDYQMLSGVLQQSMLLFVLGHEYGHMIAGHLLQVSSATEERSPVDVDALDYSWRQEFEADVVGCRLSVAAMNQLGYGPVLSFWGADFFFSAMDVMDRSTSLLLCGDENKRKLGSHPPSKDRRSHLRRTFLPLLAGESSPGATNPIEHAQIIEDVVEHLWLLGRPRIKDAHERGFRPAAQWTLL